jgi:hypothetical protein
MLSRNFDIADRFEPQFKFLKRAATGPVSKLSDDGLHHNWVFSDILESRRVGRLRPGVKR